MSELSYEASDEASENELLERSLSVWRGWSSVCEDFTPIPLDIHTASSIGQYDCVRTLIARGEVEIDRKNIGGWTPLMYACYIGHDHIVSLLIDAGCNVNLKNQRGQTPLMLAASCGNESVGRTLLRKGAELEVADHNGWTALFHATYSGHQNFVGFLLDQRANMDAAEPSSGMTPFMEAAIEGHEIIVQVFLQHGVNVNAKAYNGDTARTLALTNGHMKIVSLIDNHVLSHSSLRSEPGLGDYLSSSDELDKRQRPQHQRGSRAKSKGPSIRDGPEAIARMIDRTRATDHVRYPHLMVPRGYMTFPHGEGEEAGTLLSFRDVTSPINQEDYRLDSSGGKDSCDYNDDSNAFSKTGAITIKSSSSSSGGLIAVLGISRQNSDDSDEIKLHDSGVHNSSQSEDNTNREVKPLVGAAVFSYSEKDHTAGDAESHSVPLGGGPSSLSAGKISSQWKHVEQQKPNVREASENKMISVQKEVKNHHQQSKGGLLEACKIRMGENGHQIGDEGKKESDGTETQVKDAHQDFHLQFGDVIFSDVLGHGVKDGESQNSQSAMNPSIAHSEYHSDNHFLDRKSGLESTSIENKETLKDSTVAGVHFAPLALPVHMQRRSSCQARLSRLSVADWDNTSQGKEIRHRRKSANSPPTFHREYGGCGQDLGSGTGRVSCLSDIPANPGPQAGYPVTRSTPNTSLMSALKGSDGGDRFHGNSQVPVAAVAPTCLPAVSTAVSNQRSSAFSSPDIMPQSSLARKLSASEISASCGQDLGSVPVVSGYQSDSPVFQSDVAANPHKQLWDLMQDVGGGESPESGVAGHCDLAALLEQLGLGKYTALFLEQDVDLQVFLSLTDNDLKEIGIKLFGPRKKMTNAIARWHSQAPAAHSSLEQAYADRLEGEMQEMAIQLNQAYDSVGKLQAQVLQERQLRSVTESCLMEERGGWQQLHQSLIDTHKHCTDFSHTVAKLSAYHAELKQRLGLTSNNHLAFSGLSNTACSDLSAFTTDQLLHMTDQHLHDLSQQSSKLVLSMDHIISNPPATRPIHHTREVDHDFP